MKLWGGRFAGETEENFSEFNASLPFDYVLYPYDIAGSRIHVQMLARQNIISEEEKEEILQGLSRVKTKLDDQEDWSEFAGRAEDIHSLIEGLLEEEIGDTAGKMHTARSRNDQIALDMKLFLRDKNGEIMIKIEEMIAVLIDRAEEHVNTIMPGYTHLQPAQPITLAHLLMAHGQQLKRDHGRLRDLQVRMNRCPLGSGALAGTTLPIDRDYTARGLGFAGPAENSLDAVSERDYLLEFHGAAASIMLHIGSLAEEIVMWNSREFDFIDISDRAATGSSIMPQKKNPDIAELTRAKSGRIIGNYTGLAHTLKALPLAYNKDLQEDKEGIFDTVKTLNKVLPVFSRLLDELTFKEENMSAAAEKSYLNATELADYMVEKGIPFRRAHEITGEIVRHAEKKGVDLAGLPQSVFEKNLPLSREDMDCEEIKQRLKIKRAVKERDVKGGPAPEAVRDQIEELSAWLDDQQ